MTSIMDDSFNAKQRDSAKRAMEAILLALPIIKCHAEGDLMRLLWDPHMKDAIYTAFGSLMDSGRCFEIYKLLRLFKSLRLF